MDNQCIKYVRFSQTFSRFIGGITHITTLGYFCKLLIQPKYNVREDT